MQRFHKYLLNILIGNLLFLSIALGQQTLLRQDGFYYTVKKTGGKLYEGVMEPARTWISYWFFYADGSFADVGSGPINNDSAVGLSYLNRRTDSLRILFTNKERIPHGRYTIHGDTLHMISLALKSSGFGNMGKVESFVRILEPETLSFFSEYCKWCKGDIRGFLKSAWWMHEPPIEYRFYPFDTRPDSTLSRKEKRLLTH